MAAISTAGINEVALLGRGADAAAVTTQRGAAALGLALIVLEVE